MAFSVLTTAGATVTLDLGDKLVLDGRDLYVNAIGPYAQGARRRHRLLAPRNVSIARFSQINASTLVPEYQSAVTVPAQIKGTDSRVDYRRDPDAGPEQPRTEKIAYFQEAVTGLGYPLIQVELVNAPTGRMFASLFTVKYWPRTSTGGNANAGIPATVADGTAVTLSPRYVDLSEQWDIGPNRRVLLGDLKLIVPRESLTRAQMLANHQIGLTPRGGSELRYQIVNSPDGFETPQSYDWCLVLKRVRP
jgi:hypothetical protein